MPNLLKAKGLYTYRNETTVPEGAMDVADNIIIDEDDVIELRRGQADYGTAFPNLEDRAKQLIQYKDLILRHYSNIVQFDDGTGNFTNFDGNYEELETGLRLKYIEANGNLYFTEKTGVKKISARNQSQVVASSIENAGVPRAVSLEAFIQPTIGGFLPPQSKVAYRVLWGKKDNNSNLLLGSPSERFVLTNVSSSTEISETFTFLVVNVPDNDDIIIFNTPSEAYFVWFDTTGSETRPETAETLGRTEVKVSLLDPAETQTTAASKIANALAGLATLNVSVSSNLVTVSPQEAGDVPNADTYRLGVNPSANITPSSLEQGSITEGDSANAEITFSVPSGIDQSYFYQVYRTNALTLPEGLTLDEIDPGDEMNLVFEGNPVDSNGNLLTEVTVTDIVTDDFRAANDFLYTNPISGEGILQANSAPPVAKDIALFSGSTFYANTKTTHKLEFNLVSTLSLTSGVSQFIIGNSSVVRKYTSVGATQVQDMTINTATPSTTAFLIDSVKNERKYTVWYDQGGLDSPPTDSEYDSTIFVRVRYDLGDTTDEIATKTAEALSGTGDFSVSVLGSVLTITWARNGNVGADARDSVADATGFIFSAPSTDGDGEDLATQEFTLSNFVSAAASIDESARSLVKVINADSLSPVNAYYISGADDVPGIILLEARNLEDNPFYIGTNDSNIQESFDPSLTLEKTITSTTQGSTTNIESALHGLSTGQEVFIYNTTTTPVIQGKFEVTVVDANNFTVNFETSTDTLNDGEFLLASNESDNEEASNRLYFSKTFQPEAVPALNFLDIGPKDQAILRILPLRDNLFALKEDGVYIISGTSAPNFTVRLLDSSVSLVAPDSAVVLNNSIYALTDDGVVRISDTGVQVISRPIEDVIKSVVNSRFNFRETSFGISYTSDRSYLLWLPTNSTDTVATQCYRYNTFTRSWTRFDLAATCGLLFENDDKMYLGYADRNYISQERKNGDRTDYADRNFDLQLIADGVQGNVLTLSNVLELERGDVVYQEQYVTISVLRRLAKKLDIDRGIASNDYLASINLNYGTKLSAQISTIIGKLLVDGIAVTNPVISDDPTTQQTQFNNLIDELNDIASGTIFKDYKKAELLVPYEMVIDTISTINNKVTIRLETPFVEGDITIFKGIKARFQYAPEHFGDPTSLKQIRQGTIIFDQNNFYGGFIDYASDQSADFVETPFSGYGIGDFGVPAFGTDPFGGLGNDIPYRTLVPLEKQRCRYLTVRIRHTNAREIVRINGISLMVRQLSERAYR